MAPPGVGSARLMEIVEARVERLEAGRARRAHAMAAGERTVNTAASLSVAGSSVASRKRSAYGREGSARASRRRGWAGASKRHTTTARQTG
jgi:hypothetical protein